MLSRLLRVKTVAVAGLTLLSIGGVAAAATGLAPASAERAVTSASPHTPDGQAGHAQGVQCLFDRVELVRLDDRGHQLHAQSLHR